MIIGYKSPQNACYVLTVCILGDPKSTSYTAATMRAYCEIAGDVRVRIRKNDEI